MYTICIQSVYLAIPLYSRKTVLFEIRKEGRSLKGYDVNALLESSPTTPALFRYAPVYFFDFLFESKGIIQSLLSA